MSDLICIEKFHDKMEAELVRNSLEQAGIPGSVSVEERSGGHVYGLFVNPLDVDRAREALREKAGENETGSGMEEEPFDQEAAQREFDEIRMEELKGKAASVKSSAMAIGGSVAAAVILFFAIPDKGWGVRLALACLFFAVIEFFVWRDCLNARDQLRKAGRKI